MAENVSDIQEEYRGIIEGEGFVAAREKDRNSDSYEVTSGMSELVERIRDTGVLPEGSLLQEAYRRALTESPIKYVGGIISNIFFYASPFPEMTRRNYEAALSALIGLAGRPPESLVEEVSLEHAKHGWNYRLFQIERATGSMHLPAEHRRAYREFKAYELSEERFGLLLGIVRGNIVGKGKIQEILGKNKKQLKGGGVSNEEFGRDLFCNIGSVITSRIKRRMGDYYRFLDLDFVGGDIVYTLQTNEIRDKGQKKPTEVRVLHRLYYDEPRLQQIIYCPNLGNPFKEEERQYFGAPPLKGTEKRALKLLREKRDILKRGLGENVYRDRKGKSPVRHSYSTAGRKIRSGKGFEEELKKYLDNLEVLKDT